MKQHAERVIDSRELPVWQSPDGARRVSPGVGRDNCGAKGICTSLFWLAPGQETVLDVHQGSEEIYYVVSGEARLLLEGETFRVAKGMTVYIPAGASHQSINTGEEDLCYFCAFSPPPAGPWRHETENWPRVP